MIWENQNCKTWFVSLKNLQASWGKTTPEWHKTICVSLESVIHCLVQSENLLLKCVNRNWEDKKMVLAAQRKGEFSCTLRGGGVSHHLTYLLLSPASSLSSASHWRIESPLGVPGISLIRCPQRILLGGLFSVVLTKIMRHFVKHVFEVCKHCASWLPCSAC